MLTTTLAGASTHQALQDLTHPCRLRIETSATSWATSTQYLDPTKGGTVSTAEKSINRVGINSNTLAGDSIRTVGSRRMRVAEELFGV